MFLTIKVEKVEFADFSDRLRMLGKITEGPQDHGQHHTIDLEPGDDVTIHKERGWHHHHLERIKEAQAASRMPLLTFVALDDETATIAVLRPQGLQVVANISADIQGKQFDHKAKGEKEAYLKEILDTLGHQLDTGTEERRDVIVLGPGFYKEDFVAYAREKKLEANLYVEAASQAGAGGIREVLKAGATRSLEKAKAAEDERIMAELLAEIGKGGKFMYGIDQVIDALERGAVETLLLTEDFLRDGRMERIGRLVQETRANIRVLSTGYDAGRRLEGLGGLAALLRYKIDD
jgi:protein pelota